MNTSASQGAFQCVLVPIDFSDDSMNALQLAQRRFASADATLVLVHSVDAAEGVIDHAGLREQVVSSQASEVQRQMQTLAGAHREGWKEVQAVVEAGKPADVILSAAQTWHADLVVMGSHGKTSLVRKLFGGTTYHVARKLDCSVLVLRSGKTA